MANIRQYYESEDLIKIIPFLDINVSDLGSTDTYNEDKLLKKYFQLDKEGQNLVYKAAIQLAVVGYGNKNYGFIRKNDKDIILLEDIFKRYNIKYNEKINIKFNDDDLSVRRILRLFRSHIKKFIVEKKKPSYLWTKYADKKEFEFLPICFPGGEHLVQTEKRSFVFIRYIW